MPSIHFRTTVDAPPEDVYAALATQEGLAGNRTDQLEVPEETGGVARFGFGPDWAKTLELRIDDLESARRVEWTPVGGFPGWIGTSIAWELEPAEDGGTVVHFTHGGWPDQAAAARSSSAARSRSTSGSGAACARSDRSSGRSPRRPTRSST